MNNYDMQKGGGELNPQEALAIRYYCLGEPIPVAAMKSKVTESSLRRLVKSKKGQTEIANLRTEIDDEFMNMAHAVNETLSEALKSADVGVALAASNMWLRTAKAKKVEVNITAEDILQKLFEKPDADVIDVEHKEVNLKVLK